MSDLFKMSKRESAVDVVINSIKQLMIDRRLCPGDKLPSETEIAEGLGVSRGSVREAMKILAAFGLIDIKIGNGTYVCDVPGSGLMDSLLFTFYITNPDISELYEFRLLFEVDIVRLAIQHFSENGRQRLALRENLEELKSLLDAGTSDETFLKNDLEFHRILGDACCNALAANIYNFIMNTLSSSVSKTYKVQNGEYIYKAHSSILETIENRAVDNVETCIRSTLDIWYEQNTDAVFAEPAD